MPADDRSPQLAAAAETFADDLDRTVDRLTSMSLPRLDHGDESGRTPAGRAHELSAYLVSVTDSLTGSASRIAQLPRLRSHAAGAQLAVVGRELAAAAQSCADQAAALHALTEAALLLRTFRRDSL